MNEGSKLATLQKENASLIQKNEQLNSDLLTLQKQFQSAVDVSSSFQNISKKNEDLSKQIRVANEEKEDLQRRLKIALQNIEELKDKLTNEEKRVNNNTFYEIEALKNKIEDERKQYQLQISQLQNKMSSIEHESQRKDIEIQKFNSDLQSIFQASKQYFNQNVDSIEALIYLFNSPPEKSEHSFSIVTESSYIDNIPNPMTEVEKKKIKRKIKSQMQKKILLEKQSIERDLKQRLEAPYIQKISELNAANEELRNKIDRLTNENDSLKSNSFRTFEENSQLKIQMEFLKNDQKNKMINKMMNLNDHLKDVNSKLNASEQSNEILKKQVGSLMSKLQISENENQKLTKKFQKISINYEEISEEKEKVDQNNEVLGHQNNELQSKIIQLTQRTNDLQTLVKQLQNSLNEKNIEAQQMLSQIESLEKTNTIQVEEIQTHQIQIENLSKMLKDESDKANKLKILSQQLEENCKNLEESSKIAHQKLLKAKEPSDASLILPLSVWSIPELPNDLIQCVQEVVNNSTLQTPTKIRQVMSIICQYFISKDENNQNKINEMQNKENQFHENILNFSNFLQNLFPEIEENFDNIIENNVLQMKISELISQIRSEIQNSLDYKNRFEKQALDILLILQVDSLEEGVHVINEMNNHINELEKYKEKQSHKILQLKKRYEILKTDFSKQIKQIQESMQNRQNDINQVQEKNDNLSNKLNEANQIIEKNKSKFEQSARESKIIYDTKIAEYEKKNLLLNEQINTKQKTINDLHEENAKLKNDYTKSINNIKLLRENKKKLSHQIQELNSKIATKEEEHDQKIRTERNIFQSRIKEESERYRSELQSLTNLCDEMKAKLEEYENTKSNLQMQINDLSLRLQKAELKYSTVVKESERDKLVISSQYKTEILQLKTHFQDELSEKDIQINEVKRNLMSNIALQFCSLFDANVEMNDTNFMLFIQSIKAKMTELISCESKLRSLLQIGPQQSIIDCVSRLLLSTSKLLS